MRELLPADLVAEVSPSHLVALRFAGDGELANLVRDVLAGKLTTQKAIKPRIKDWKGDHLRVAPRRRRLIERSGRQSRDGFSNAAVVVVLAGT